LISLLRLPYASRVFAAMSFAGLGIFILAVAVLMQPAASIVGERTAELVCFQLAFTAERATEIVLSFPQEGREAIGQLLVPGDLALAWGYGLVLAGLLGLLTMRLPGKWLRAGAFFMWAPLLATVLDCVENMFLYSTVSQLAANPTAVIAPAIPMLAGLAATAKWLALSVVTPAYGFAGIAKGITIDRRVSSWVVYGLLAMTLFSMVQKPLQDIPPCF
jgi:hypothetical protein